ncbi:hypothetical protein BC941DRAFT_466562 [Chlamydoabsidia padenii]|nr:hypothetical protein BC941DRAFT_466562 [Chlamydoabsidia padenii]
MKDSYMQYTPTVMMNATTPIYMGGIGSINTGGSMMACTSFAMGGGGVGDTGSEISRTIYLGGLAKDTTAHDIFNIVKTGAVESLRVLPEKGCAFLNFVEPLNAQLFYQDFNNRALQLQGNDIKVGWGKPGAINLAVQNAIQQGATRNVFIGQVGDDMTSDSLKSDLAVFGDIELVKIVRDKRIAFVYFTSVAAALNCVNTLNQDPAWTGRRINYGRDRCFPVHLQQQQQQQYQHQHQQQQMAAGHFMFGGDGGHDGHFQFGFDAFGGGGGGGGPNPMMAAFGHTTSAIPGATMMAADGQFVMHDNPERTIYLGNLPPDIKCEDLCNAIRGGKVYQIRHIKEKSMAFVTFVDANAAAALYAHGNSVGLAIGGRRARVGWGKPTKISPHTLQAIQQQGASRNLYIGRMDRPIPTEQLLQDFAEYGEVELINSLPEKKCTFVNFTSINSAMRARQGIASKTAYAGFRINYGKDRCEQPLRISNARLHSMQHQQRNQEQQPIHQQPQHQQQPEQQQHQQEQEQYQPLSPSIQDDNSDLGPSDSHLRQEDGLDEFDLPLRY